MDVDDLCFAGAAQQTRLIRDGEVSARELVQATLDRIAAVDPHLNCYRVVLADEALLAADKADARVARGETLPLLGVPVAIKDDVAVAGTVTAWGTSANDLVEADDAPIVAGLRVAGAVVIGKTTCSELVVWPFTETPAWGATRNPWDLRFSPGGSSGGSGSAVAAGLCGLALGSDGLGSIRVPAGFNGVFGLKPQRGRTWHADRDWYGMAVNGPLCRSVADAALFLDAVGSDGPAGGFAAAIDRDIGPLRIALAWKSAAPYPLAARLGPAQRAAVLETADLLRSLGHTIDEREVGFPVSTANSYMLRYLAGVAETLPLLDRPDAVSSRTKTMARLGRMIPGWALARSIAAETGIAAKVNRVFDDFDVVLTPGAVEAPLRIGDLDGRGAIRTLYASGRKIPHFAPWNVIGQPAVSVPAGSDDGGLPLSVQLGGQANDEATLLSLAAQIERARPWATRRPQLPTGP